MRSVRLAEQSLLAASATGAGDLDEAMARLHVAQDALGLMAGMLEDVLAGPADAGAPEHSSCPLDVEVPRTVDSLKPLAADLGVVLEASVDPAAAQLDAGPLSIVMHNGLRNAIQACDGTPSGHVVLAVHVSEAQELRIEITDTGAGVTPSSSSQESRARTGKSHGIGLELSRRIVARMGGSLTLTGLSTGRGSQFRVIVPLAWWAAP